MNNAPLDLTRCDAKFLHFVMDSIYRCSLSNLVA